MPRVIASTRATGPGVASRGRIPLVTALHIMAGVGLATAGALALNQYVERDVDARTVRTRFRPLPAGRLGATTAFIFGSALLMAGMVYLAVAVGALPALLTVFSAAAYHGAYVPLKMRSSLATLAGGVPGARTTSGRASSSFRLTTTPAGSSNGI